MRLGFFLEGVSLIAIIGVSSFLIFDEEPILDFSDWNSMHVWLLTVSLFVVFFELTMRARFGQYLFKDTATLLALFTFWFGLENYIRLLLFVFASHALTPLEAELLELVEVYQYMSSWFILQVVTPALCISVLYALLFIKNLMLPWAQARVLGFLTYCITFGLLVTAAIAGWDFLLSGLSSMSSWFQNEIFYLQPKTAFTYDRGLMVSDQFEFHRERTWAFSLHFEDLYFFFFQLLLVWNLSTCLVFFFYLCLAVGGCLIPTISYTQLALGFMFFEHVLVLLLLMAATFVVSGLRLWLRTPSEFLF